MKNLLCSVAVFALCANPVSAENHNCNGASCAGNAGQASPAQVGRYSSFVLKIPYDFDLPPNIEWVVLVCGMYSSTSRTGPVWPAVIELESGQEIGRAHV